jgi:Uma2 family endonuclease
MTLVREPEDPQPYLLTLEDFETLHRTGAFDRHPKVELIEGVILQMNPQKNRHSFIKSELGFRLAAALKEIGGPFRAVVEPTLAIPPDSAPEPDIAVTSDHPRDGYMELATIALLVEVSSTTLAFDLRHKAGLYARNGVPEYWVVELDGMLIHRHWNPQDGSYADKDEVPIGGTVASVTVSALRIDTADLG